jgi:adenylate cyclase
VKNKYAAVLLTLLSLALVMLMSRTGAFRTYENKTLDSRFSWRHRVRGPISSPDIRIIGIDDQTLLSLGGRWPIPWRWHALLLEALSDKLPAVAAYNILFPSAEGEERDDERQLAEATQRLGDVVYPYYFEFAEAGAARGGVPADAGKNLQKNAFTNVDGDVGSLPQTADATMPIAPLAAHSSLGFANAEGDEVDGVVRRMPLILGFEGKVYPSFCLMAVLRYYNIALDNVRVALGRQIEFDVPGAPRVSIPIDAEGRMAVNFTADYDEFGHSVFSQVVQSFARRQQGLSSPIDLSDFEGKLVLVGLTATGVIEAYTKPTPLDPNSPFLTAQANAINTILSRSFPRAPSFWAATGILLLLGALVGAIASSMKAATSLVFSAICLGIFIVVSYWLFFVRTLILPLVPGSCMAIFTYTLITSYRYATEERQRRFYRGVLGKYLSHNVMETILDRPDELKLGGERKEMTVLFADVKGFTKFCERSPVEEIAPRLNELHEKMTRIVWKYDGTLDKYMGDGIMAFWGAPLPQKDHARRAVLAALDMIEELKQMRPLWESRGVEPFFMGIGINTGTMVVGNMGSNEFWNYTVVGDEVNLAARLEGLTRSQGADVIVSEFTYRLVRDIAEARLLGEATVKGKEKPVVIYGLTGIK